MPAFFIVIKLNVSIKISKILDVLQLKIEQQ